MNHAQFRLPNAGATWVFADDSITQGVYHTHGARSWVEPVRERIRCELDRLEDIVINSGDSGLETSDIPALSDAPASRRRHFAAYAEKVRAVATKNRLVLVDHESNWRNFFTTAAATPWMVDHTHPNAVGHREMANATLLALGLGALDARAQLPVQPRSARVRFVVEVIPDREV